MDGSTSMKREVEASGSGVGFGRDVSPAKPQGAGPKQACLSSSSFLSLFVSGFLEGQSGR